MPGCPPKSAAAKKAAGNPGKRPIKDNVAPAVAGPQPPAWVASRPKALEQWHALAPEMLARKTLTLFDVNAFGRYCLAMAMFLESVVLLEKHGMVNVNIKTGMSSKSAALNAFLDLSGDLRSTDAPFGFSPVSRNKLFTSEGDEGLSPREKELRALEGGA